MTVMVISFIFGFSIVSALEFSFSSPGSVEVEEEFEVTIDYETEDLYDVKIFVYEDEISNIVSKVYHDEEWKNPFYYLQDVFPAEKTFKIKVIDFIGDTEICVRLREANETSGYDQSCTAIEIGEAEESENADEENNGDGESDNDESNGDDNLIQDNGQEFDQLSDTLNEKGKIILNSPIENIEKGEETGDKVFISKQERLRFFIVISFLVLAVVLIILLALRKL